MTNVQYEQPREKLAKKGAQSLSNTELLQVIIGSGNAQVSVGKIAKKVAKVLSTSGSAVHPQELLVIQGVGKVKAGQILALFELAARFPVISTGKVYGNKQQLKSLYSSLSKVQKQTLLYVTFDGGHRIISKRQTVLSENTSVPKQAQKIFADCLVDSATSVLIAVGHSQQQLDPGLTELMFTRSVYKTSQLLSIPIKQVVLVSKQGDSIVKELLP